MRWIDLSAGYRSRLIGAARSGKLTGTKITGDVEAQARVYYEHGGTKGGKGLSARGHANPAYVNRPSTAAPRVATQRESNGMGDSKTWDQLERWRARSSRNGGPPKWIPSDPMVMSTDTAAILSQLDIPPSKWKKVRFDWQPAGGALVHITPYRGKTRIIQLPDHKACSELGHFIKEGDGAHKGLEVEAPVNSPTPGQLAA